MKNEHRNRHNYRPRAEKLEDRTLLSLSDPFLLPGDTAPALRANSIRA